MFHKEHFCHISSTNRGCPQYSIYVYKTTDSVETMLTEGYFNEALLDLQKNDVIAAAIISETDSTEYERVYFRVTQRTLDTVAVQETHSALIDEVESNLQSQIKTNANNIAKLQTNKADKTTDFETPITASNKGATMMEINNLVQLGNKITNCILQIPQNINLTLENGTLTLKAGSKVYVPNGAGVFNEVTVGNDAKITLDDYGTQSNIVVMYNQHGNAIHVQGLSFVFSGATAPSGNEYMVWYDTTNNFIKTTSNSGKTWSITNNSLPIALITSKSNVITSIDQVFNGFGFIGSTVFALPGVKGLIPNGRNEDGTLKNIVVNNTSVKTVTKTTGYSAIIAVAEEGAIDGYTVLNYYPEQNMILNSTGAQIKRFNAGTVIFGTNGKITSFEPKPAFHAVDYNEYAKDLSDINETLEDKASLSEPQTIGGKYTFTKTIDSNATPGMQINQALDAGGVTAWRVYDATNSRQIRSVGFYANSKIYNRLSIVGSTGVEGYLNFSMTDNGTMNIELGSDKGGKEYLPSKGANNASFATTKWVQRELGDYAQNDLSNISAEGIDTAVGWGIPDYSAAVTGTTPYTAPANGCAFIKIRTQDRNYNLLVNGLSISSFSGSNINGDVVTVFISKNDKITTTFGILNITFCPLKGS